MLAAVAKRTKLAFFDDPYRSLASNSNKSKKKNIKKPTVSASVHSKLWMTMSWNARPLGERDTMFWQDLTSTPRHASNLPQVGSQ